MKKVKRIFCLVLVIVFAFSAGVFSQALTEKIEAYKSYEVTVDYNGLKQDMKDGNGNPVYPIMYQGTTYLPVRAVCNMLDIPVEWDGVNHVVKLGTTQDKWDLINELTPHRISDPYDRCADPVFTSAEGQTITVFGKEYDHFIKTDGYQAIYYNLEGKYKTLTLTVSCYLNCVYNIEADGKKIVSYKQIFPSTYPEPIVLDVTGVKELCINGSNLYVYDAVLE